MQVVNVFDVDVRGECLPDLLDVHPLGSCFEQDTTGVSKQAVGRSDHDRRDDQRGDPVGAGVSGGDDDDARDRGEDEGGEVGEDVLEAALDVHRLAVGLRQLPGGDEVYRNPGKGDDQDQLALGGWGRDQAADALV